MKRLFYDHLKTLGCVEITDSYANLIPECKCAYLYPNDSNRYVRTLFHDFY